MAEPLQSSGDGESPRLSELAGASNVLLQSPSLGPAKTETCHQLLDQTDPAETNVIAVTFTQTPSEWIEEYTDRAGGPPARGGVIAVGESVDAVEDPTWTVEHVESASDVTGLGIELSDMLSRLSTVATAEDQDIVVCFDSITSLLQYVDLQGTFRFLHVVTGRVKKAGGVAHYHIDPAAHDDQELATLLGLFDAVVDVDEDGTLDIRR